jgi:hypothetical protein
LTSFSLYRLCIAGALASLGACATDPAGSAQASPGSAIANEWQLPAPNTGKLIVTRDSGFMGAACSQRIYVDGTPIADLRSGQSVTVYLPVGEHVAGVMHGGLCGGGSSSTNIIMVSGATKVYRVASGQSGDIKIEPSAF